MKNSNKFQIRAVLVLVIGLSLFSKMGLSREYRIQYVSQQDESYLFDLNKVEEKQVYILPNGSKLYFTTDTYSCFETAKRALDKMVACGFKAAKIRTFFGHKVSANNHHVTEGMCK